MDTIAHQTRHHIAIFMERADGTFRYGLKSTGGIGKTVSPYLFFGSMRKCCNIWGVMNSAERCKLIQCVNYNRCTMDPSLIRFKIGFFGSSLTKYVKNRIHAPTASAPWDKITLRHWRPPGSGMSSVPNSRYPELPESGSAYTTWRKACFYAPH